MCPQAPVNVLNVFCCRLLVGDSPPCSAAKARFISYATFLKVPQVVFKPLHAGFELQLQSLINKDGWMCVAKLSLQVDFGVYSVEPSLWPAQYFKGKVQVV